MYPCICGFMYVNFLALPKRVRAWRVLVYVSMYTNRVFLSQAEFKGGILVCKAGLALRKSSDDQVIIEGPISEAYFQLRAVLYSEYSFV